MQLSERTMRILHHLCDLVCFSHGTSGISLYIFRTVRVRVYITTSKDIWFTQHMFSLLGECITFAGTANFRTKSDERALYYKSMASSGYKHVSPADWLIVIT
jgi:hypothetical protein